MPFHRRPDIISLINLLNNKNLLFKTREVAKEKKYAFIWTRNAKIYVRKEENGRRIRIFKLSDLEKL